MGQSPGRWEQLSRQLYRSQRSLDRHDPLHTHKPRRTGFESHATTQRVTRTTQQIMQIQNNLTLQFSIKINKTPNILKTESRPWPTGLRRTAFKLIQHVAALVRSPVVRDFSTSVWDGCQPSIVRNLGSYLFVILVLIQKANNG